MAFESAETFSSSVKNGAGSGAVGLIQFMPNTAKSLGTNSQALGAMTPEQQLVFVFKHFEPYKKKIKSLSDMYMAILSPVYISSPDSTPLFSGGIAYRQNAGLDANRDGKSNKGRSFSQSGSEINKRYVLGYRGGLMDLDSWWNHSGIKAAVFTALAVFGGFFGYIMRALDNEHKISYVRAVLESLAAGFVGLLVMLLCNASGFSDQWTGVVVGVSGWLGANASIRVLERSCLRN